MLISLFKYCFDQIWSLWAQYFVFLKLFFSFSILYFIIRQWCMHTFITIDLYFLSCLILSCFLSPHLLIRHTLTQVTYWCDSRKTINIIIVGVSKNKGINNAYIVHSYVFGAAQSNVKCCSPVINLIKAKRLLVFRLIVFRRHCWKSS